MSPCPCGEKDAQCDTRCVECIPSKLSCKRCFLVTHRGNPLHWAEVWNSKFFECKDPSSFGGVLHLGHAGSPCPHVESSKADWAMTIVHTNGVHSVNVRFCLCHGAAERWGQLIACRLFPATLDLPKTAFTVSLMKLSHLISLSAQSSVHSLSQALRRLTNDPFVDKVLVSTFIQYGDCSDNLLLNRELMTTFGGSFVYGDLYNSPEEMGSCTNLMTSYRDEAASMAQSSVLHVPYRS